MSTTNQEPYNAIADAWNASRSKSEIPPLVEEFAGMVHAGGKILDVGCGTGIPNARFLVGKGFEVIGIDISENLLEIARNNVPEGLFQLTDIMTYETESKFAGILAWDSLFHLKIDEHEAAFAKLADMLAPGGVLLFTHGGAEGEIEGEMYGEKFTYSSIGPLKIKSLLLSLGLTILWWEHNTADENGYLVAMAQKSGS